MAFRCNFSRRRYPFTGARLPMPRRHALQRRMSPHRNTRRKEKDTKVPEALTPSSRSDRHACTRRRARTQLKAGNTSSHVSLAAFKRKPKYERETRLATCACVELFIRAQVPDARLEKQLHREAMSGNASRVGYCKWRSRDYSIPLIVTTTIAIRRAKTMYTIATNWEHDGS